MREGREEEIKGRKKIGRRKRRRKEEREERKQ